MDTVLLARIQFGMTTLYHFFFVPLSIGLAFLVALMETRYVKSGNEYYKKMAQFWGRLFLINAAVGIVTGIVQEFQFGMNWSEYSRFVGDIFGAPLAIETLLAFFLESTFLGIWIFGWDKLNKWVHLACIWLVVLGSLMSAFWILVANSFMQHPVGYTLNNGRAELSDFGALLTNSNLWVQFPHVVMGALVMGSFFVMGVSAYNLLKKRGDNEFFRRSLHLAVLVAVVATMGAAIVGDMNGKNEAKTNPMKLAASEALWNSEKPASEILFAVIDEEKHQNYFEIKVPAVLSFLAHGDFDSEVVGINQLQAEYEKQYGPGNYIPSVWITFITMRGMVGAGVTMIMLASFALFLAFRRKLATSRWFLRILVGAMVLPYVSNFCGWLLAETGRQPWVVFGVMKTESAVSTNLSPEMVLTTIIIFAVLYIGLMGANIYLMTKFAKGDDWDVSSHHRLEAEEDDTTSLAIAY